MKNQKKVFSVVCGFLYLLSLWAEAKEESFWGVDLAMGTAHQEYEAASADMNSVSVTPYVLASGWELSMSLPWYDIDGNYFTNGTLPRVLDVCNRLLALSDTRQQRLIRRGRITQDQLDACQLAVNELDASETAASGVGDLGFYANYVVNLTDSGEWWGGLGLAYTLDNGDYEKGLGKGSRDASVQLSLGSSISQWQTQVMLGYVMVDPTDTTDEVDNYAQASVGLGYAFTDWLTLGVDYSIEESYFADEENVKTLTLYSDFSVAEEWKVHIYATDYAQIEQYPESEIGASILYSF